MFKNGLLLSVKYDCKLFFALLILSALVKHVSLQTAAQEGIFNSFKSIFVQIKFKKSYEKRIGDCWNRSEQTPDLISDGTH